MTQRIAELIGTVKTLLSKKCPICGKGHQNVIHGWLPMKICADDQCNCIWGVWSWWLDVVPFNGWLMVYRGNYFSALWRWIWIGE